MGITINVSPGSEAKFLMMGYPFSSRKASLQTNKKGTLVKNLDNYIFTEKQHIATVHKQERPFLCTLCGLSFQQSSNLKMHTKSVHEQERPFQCKYCQKTFARKCQMSEHVLSAHEGARVLKCGFCDKKFTTERRRRAHEFIHKNIRKFECSLCDAKFKRCHHLDTHMRTIHSQIK